MKEIEIVYNWGGTVQKPGTECRKIIGLEMTEEYPFLKVRIDRNTYDLARMTAKQIEIARNHDGSEAAYGNNWSPSESFPERIYSCLGEIICAANESMKWWGYCEEVPQKGDADIGPQDLGGFNLQVRTTKSQYLRLHREDRDEDVFFDVYRPEPFRGILYIRGWLIALDGKKDEFWWEPQKGRPCFNVPFTRENSMAISWKMRQGMLFQ